MTLCFLGGSESHGIRIDRTIECITVDEDGKVHIACDFFLHNNSDKPLSFIAIHRGNPHLNDVSSEWFDRGNQDTKTVTDIFQSFDKEFNVVDAPNKYVRVKSQVIVEPGEQVAPRDYLVDTEAKLLEDETIDFKLFGGNPYMTAVKSSKLGRDERRLIRLRCEISCAELNELVGPQPEVEVVGEERLVSKIQEDIEENLNSNKWRSEAKDCLDFFNVFVEHNWVSARQCHFAVSPYKEKDVYPISTNLNVGFQNRAFNGLRKSWFWWTTSRPADDNKSKDPGSRLIIERDPWVGCEEGAGILYHGNR